MLDSDIRYGVGEALLEGRQDVVPRRRLRRGWGPLLSGGRGRRNGSGNGRQEEATWLGDSAPWQRCKRLGGEAPGAGWFPDLRLVERYHSERNSQFKTNTQPKQT